jgi:hypothetical protein
MTMQNLRSSILHCVSIALLLCAPLTGITDEKAGHLSSAQLKQLSLIVQSLQRDGPKLTMERYFSCERDDDYGLVETGEPRAVAVAFALYPYTDACGTLSLHSAISAALWNNPLEVLPYINRLPEGRDSNCVPFISNELTKEQYHTLTERMKRAESTLGRVKRSDLQAVKNLCVNKIEEAIHSIQQTP